MPSPAVRRRTATVALCLSAVTLSLATPAFGGDMRGPWKRGMSGQAAAGQPAAAPGATVTPPEAPRPTGVRSPVTVPSSIARDCSADVSGELNAWLANLPAEGIEVRFPTRGCFRTERTVTVKGKTDWVVDGNGSELRRTEATPTELRYPKNNRHLAVVDSQDLTLREFRVVGLNTVSDVPKQPAFGRYLRELEFEHAYSAWNSRRLVFEELYADAPFGDGVYLHSNTSDVVVREVDIARNGRQGIGVLASRVLIDGAVLHSSRRAGVDLEPDSAPMSDVEVRNSTISSHLLAFASAGRGDVNRIHLHHNTIRRSGVPFIYAARDGYRRDAWTVTDNWVQPQLGSPAAAMRFGNARNVVVMRNVVPVATTQSRLAFQIEQGTNLRAHCNNFRNARPELVQSLDGTTARILSDNNTTKEPPSCLNRLTVGAPRGPEPRQMSNDYFSAAIALPALAPGAATPPYAVDNATFSLEEFEPRTPGTSGRTVWFRYRTGATQEMIEVRTTGALRSILAVTGDDLYWSTEIANHYHKTDVDLAIPARTVVSIQLDDSTYYTGEETVGRSVIFTRVK